MFTAVPDDTNDEKAKGFGYELILPRLKSFAELNTWLKKNIGIHFVKQAQAVKFLQVTAGESKSVISGG
ncbi:hypothetical protein [Pedobacter psychrodurus]|uniref:hypothetical protein n=1 Tax=Pedobacter psychrodurus TaxID=2530456 RepID=UPI00292CB547|nr:hypothetical protein [Pedobacter psychrodurus]